MERHWEEEGDRELSDEKQNTRMFQKSRKTMKWSSLLKDIKERVGLSQSSSVSASSSLSSPAPQSSPANVSSSKYDAALCLSRDKHELELDFKRYWEEFRSSSSEKDKEAALNLTVDVFSRLVKQHTNVAQLVTMLVETHVFSFVVGRAFVTDIGKLKINSKTRSLDVLEVLKFFSEVSKDGLAVGANLLTAVEVLVSGPIDKQSLLDSGILCCLIHILNSLLRPSEAKQGQKETYKRVITEKDTSDVGKIRILEIEASVVHIMKALSSHPSAAQSLIEDDSLRLLFQMVANGSLTVFSQFMEGIIPLHTIQLHRHAMQILSLLLVNDNGSTAKYIHKHHLIKILLMTVKDFNPNCGDAAYTMSIVDRLLECVELSYRPEAGGIRLREDIHNAHGYHFLVQFALVLSEMPNNPEIQSIHCESSSGQNSPLDDSHVNEVESQNLTVHGGKASEQNLSLVLARLLDFLVNLAQTGPIACAGLSGSRGSKFSHSKASGHDRSHASSFDQLGDDFWENDNTKIKDLEAIQVLQDIFLKADSRELQAEVLNRLFKLFSSHLENYKLCQQLRTVPLFILNMAGFPLSLQDIILKILDYAVTVVSCVPEQELLSLCCLLQQPITSHLKHAILSLFLKFLSFDLQYQKILREVGVLEVLLDDLKQHKFLCHPEQHYGNTNNSEERSSSISFKKHLDSIDGIISSPKLMNSGAGKFLIFEVGNTIDIGWACLLDLLRKADVNQAAFRSANGVTVILPFLASDSHRVMVLRVLQCLITEDTSQVHSEELGALVEVLKSGMVTSVRGSQYRLHNDAKCDTLGYLWRIMGVNSSAQRVFGEATGFSLLLTTLHSFQSNEGNIDQSSLMVYNKLFTYLMRVIAAGVCDNPVNRMKLHTVIASQSFSDILSESGLLRLEYERQVVQLLFELALEMVLSPNPASEGALSLHTYDFESDGFALITPSGSFNPDKERVYNASAISVIIRLLLLFTPKMQLEVLKLIEDLARAGPFNQENLTSVGCVGLLLEIIHPFLLGSSPLLLYALNVIEVLGAYRLSASELRMLIRYVLQTRLVHSGNIIVNMMERLLHMQDFTMENAPLAPFVEMGLGKVGHASIQVSLGERSWPPAAGYSFVCWFQFRNFFKTQAKEADLFKTGPSRRRGSTTGQQHDRHIFRIFSVGSVDMRNTFYAELYLQEDGVLTLATSNFSSLCCSGLELEEERWHHLAVVHSKPKTLAGLFQASVAFVYLNGKLRHTGKLGYSISPLGKPLQVTIGTPSSCARFGDLCWKLRSCYLFEEVLTSSCICFLYMLGRGYRGLFQDTDLLRFVPNHACSGGSMAILDSLHSEHPPGSHTQRLDTVSKQWNSKADGSDIVWDLERLGNFSLQLSGKKLIFAFDGTCTESFQASGTLSMLNLVDPLSTAASPIGGIPRFGRLNGDIYICNHCVIGDSIRPVGGMAVVLALVEAAETKDMLHMALTLLACALQQNHQNVRDMQAYRGYHLLALFLHRRMSLVDMQCLEIFFQIAACEASFSETKKIESNRTIISPSASMHEAGVEDINLSKYCDEISSVGSRGDMDDFSAHKDSFSHISEFENANMPAETSNCIVLSNADMVEHVLLDWTLWVIAPVPIQIALLGFLEHLVSMHWYRNHNLTVLRQINLVQHLLVTLQRGDVEVAVLEKLVVLLGVILEDGFLPSELENVVRFVIMTFDPPELRLHHLIIRESMGKHVIVRNMLLEMLIDLQVTISAEDLLEQWHKIVSSKLITYFLDEAVHPTSMRWVMSLLGVCLASSPTFALKFRSSGGYQGLSRVLPNFYDSPDIYYILFCLVFGKPVYPRLPEVRMLDFHALMPSDGNYGELKFVELLESLVAMAKSTFDRLNMQAIHAHETGNFSQVSGLLAELVDGNADMGGDLQGEALVHKTYAARLMGGEASAPAATTSVLRFMVDLAKMSPPFSAVCRRADFLDSCVDLYFSCVRAVCAVKMEKNFSAKPDDKYLNDCVETNSSRNTLSSLPADHARSVQTSISIRSFPPGQVSSGSEDAAIPPDLVVGDIEESEIIIPHKKSCEPVEGVQIFENLDGETIEQVSKISSSEESSFCNTKATLETAHPEDSQSSSSLNMLDSPIISEQSNSRIPLTFSPSSVIALTSWLGSGQSESKAQANANPSCESSAPSDELDLSSDSKFNYPGLSASNTIFTVSQRLLLEIDDSGYGGGPCSAGATAVLDFMAEVLSYFLTEQIKVVSVIEGILECVSLAVDAKSVLVFQGLCLSRLMNFLERRLLRDDEEDEKKLDKSRWSSNLDALCGMIVDRAYMGAFPQPAAVLKILEFLLSMLQLANKDGRIEETAPTGKGILSVARGNQLDTYTLALLKNTNRMILYCFLPSFLISIGEDGLLSGLRLQIEPKKREFSNSLHEDMGVNISTVLQLLVAHRRIIFCPSNLDTDLNCCLCVNLISLLHDQRGNVQNLAIDIAKCLLVHRRGALEELLVSKPNQGQHMDVLHGGFDRLLTGSLSDFFEWLQSSDEIVNKVLKQCAAIMWDQYIAASAKLRGLRVNSMESRRRRETGRRFRETSKLDLKHWEQINERRYALELVRGEMSTELRVVRQDKYGWVLHAESEWQNHLQQLVHERGIFPLCNFSIEEPEWQLCPIEGPYRMRKKLEHCKLKISTIQNVLNGQFELEAELPRCNDDNNLDASYTDSDLFLHLINDSIKENDIDGGPDDESLYRDFSDDVKDSASGIIGWNDDRTSSINDTSLLSALEFGGKSSTSSVPITDVQGKSDIGTPTQSSVKVDEVKVSEGKSDKELNDNGEYLIRPYLEAFEKIRFRFNCERVVGLDKHDGIFLIGELCLYVIENFYVDESGYICEKQCEDELSVIDQALGVKKDISGSIDFPSKASSSWNMMVKTWVGGRAWAYGGGAWGKEKFCSSGNLPHLWRMWKLNSVHEILKRDYQLRPVAIEIFSMDGCNDLLVFHKKEREEVFKNLVAMNLPRNSMLDTTILGATKHESNEGSRLFKIMAKSFSKRWQNGEISNFQYLMHLNTLAGRGYSDLTQYPVFPWVLADYESETLDLSDPRSFRRLDRPMGCQTLEGEDEFKKRYESWDDPEVPKFHYGSHYSSAGIVLFYLVRLPPFSAENQKLQGGQFDHADRLFNSVRDTWLSAAGKGNTSDVKELIPEFFYMPEFLENRFGLDLGEKQSGEKVGDVLLPPWAKGSSREFIRTHREALESDYVSKNLHHWIDLIFGYKQRGKAAEEAVNVFYHYTYEGSVDIDSVTDPAMKASILAQINHFGQTPKQLFFKSHVKRRTDRKLPPHPLKHSAHLVPSDVKKSSSSITQIVTFNEKILVARRNNFLKPRTYTKYVAWGFPDRSLRFLSYDQDRLLSTHENLHGGNQIQCAGASHDGQILVTGADDGLVCVWRISKDGARALRCLHLEKALCAHTAKITCVHVCQPYMLIVSGSDDCTVILWDLSSFVFVRQLPELPAPVSAIYVNELTGEIMTAAGVLLAVWSINGDCLAAANTSQLPSDLILSVSSCAFSDWMDTNWYATGHQSGAVKVWKMVHCSDEGSGPNKTAGSGWPQLGGSKLPEYRLILHRVLKYHKHPVTALHLTGDLKLLLSGDAGGHLVAWSLPEESLKAIPSSQG